MEYGFSRGIQAHDENDAEDDGQALEEISESFICCVCRDLLYKPVVLGCGHVSCFWCVHRSMNHDNMSSCPVCRNKYNHFPYICQTLHFLIMKLYPSAYKKREKEVLGEEKIYNCFSPQLDAAASGFYQQNPGSLNSVAPGENSAVVSDSTNSDTNMIDTDGMCNNVSIGDVSCGSCNDMLFRPVVLNCGHVFCAECIVSRENEMLMCNICQCPHPGDFPKVCLELDHFLDEQFSTDYKRRSKDLVMKQKETSRETPGTASSSAGKKGSATKHNLPLPVVQDGVGCDSCGMYPIIGERYKCKDCMVAIGYDLCQDCYTSRSTFPGRFNQHHTSDHEFVLIPRPPEPSVEALREQYASVAAIVAALEDIDRNLSVFDQVNQEFDNEEDHLPSSEGEENQNDNQQSHERLL